MRFLLRLIRGQRRSYGHGPSHNAAVPCANVCHSGRLAATRGRSHSPREHNWWASWYWFILFSALWQIRVARSVKYRPVLSNHRVRCTYLFGEYHGIGVIWNPVPKLFHLRELGRGKLFFSLPHPLPHRHLSTLCARSSTANETKKGVSLNTPNPLLLLLTVTQISEPTV